MESFLTKLKAFLYFNKRKNSNPFCIKKIKEKKTGIIFNAFILNGKVMLIFFRDGFSNYFAKNLYTFLLHGNIKRKQSN